jgi:hypothetical protein
MRYEKSESTPPLLNLAQKTLYVIYALCLIVAGLDILVWRA